MSDEDYFAFCSFRGPGPSSEGVLTSELEDHIEALSAAAGGGKEAYLHHWETGVYQCARCSRELYDSTDKWRGPCAWPSFRKAVASDSLSPKQVYGYNKYTCTVLEICCGGCGLFIGHAFEDAREKGDSGPHCTGWRH